MGYWGSAALGVVLTVSSPVFAEDSPNWLVGTWKVVSGTQTVNGQTSPYLGAVTGQASFGPDGRFTTVLVDSTLPKIQANSRTAGTAEENAAVVKGSLSLYGTYQLEGEVLKMHIDGSSYPNWMNTDQIRRARKVSEDEIAYENPVASAGGDVKLVFVRIK